MTDRIKVLIAIGVFTFMSTLDGSIVNIALPTMSAKLHTTTSEITWVVTIYLIIISAVLLIFGRLADLIGKSKISKIGWAIFILGSFLAGLDIGLGLPFLLFSRVVQAVGASMFMATGFGLISEVFPSESRARALAIGAMFVSIGSIAGPAIGGLILQITTWNYIFWINVPIGILAWIFGNHALPKDQPQGKFSDLDFLGALQMFALIVLLFFALNFGQTLGWSSPIILVTAVLGLVFFVTFILTERRKTAPLLDLNIFKSRLFSMSLLTALLNFTVCMFTGIIIPFYLQDYRSFEPGLAGLIMMAYPAAMLICSPIAGAIADKVNKELVSFVGITGVVISQLALLSITPHTSALYIVVSQAILGGSLGVFQCPNNALIMETVNPRYLGIAGSVNSLARNVAFVLGTTLAPIILFLSMSHQLGYRVTSYLHDKPEAFLEGMHITFLVSTIIVLISWLMSICRLISGHRNKRAKI